MLTTVEKVQKEIINLSSLELVQEVETYCGRKAVLKKFHNWLEVEVEFPDISEMITTNYGLYLCGNIRSERDHQPFNHRKKIASKIGEMGVATDGRKYCIVDAKTCNDYTILLEGGTLIKGATSADLYHGRFGDKKKRLVAPDQCEVGVSRENKKGDVGTIVAVYAPKGQSAPWHVDVKFVKDGVETVVYGTFGHFMRGTILCPIPSNKSRKKQPMVLSAAQPCDLTSEQIPPYRVTKDGHFYELEGGPDSRGQYRVFVDQVLVKKVALSDYMNETIPLSASWERARQYIGEVRLSNREKQVVTLVRWYDANNVTLSVNGELAEHRTYQNFRKGKISSDCTKKAREQYSKNLQMRRENAAFFQRQTAIGRIYVNFKGQRYALVSQRSTNDVTIIFESGTKVNTTWYACVNGRIFDPEAPECIPDVKEVNKAYDADQTAGRETFAKIGMCQPAPIPERLAEMLINQITANADTGHMDWIASGTGSDENAESRENLIRDIGVTLGRCTTALRLYAAISAEPVSTMLNELAQIASDVSDKLQSTDMRDTQLRSDITKIAQISQLSFDGRENNAYLEKILNVVTEAATRLTELLQ